MRKHNETSGGTNNTSSSINRMVVANDNMSSSSNQQQQQQEYQYTFVENDRRTQALHKETHANNYAYPPPDFLQPTPTNQIAYQFPFQSYYRGVPSSPTNNTGNTMESTPLSSGVTYVPNNNNRRFSNTMVNSGDSISNILPPIQSNISDPVFSRHMQPTSEQPRSDMFAQPNFNDSPRSYELPPAMPSTPKGWSRRSSSQLDAIPEYPSNPKSSTSTVSSGASGVSHISTSSTTSGSTTPLSSSSTASTNSLFSTLKIVDQTDEQVKGATISNDPSLQLTDDGQFQCKTCSRVFKRKSDLKVHMRTHTGERPYVCEVQGCHRAFTTASNLRRHHRNVHS